MEAKESIFVTNWWMSPQAWLIRPVLTIEYMTMAYEDKIIKVSPYSRLMDIIYQCANRGVKVYILLYTEYSIALTLKSEYVENIVWISYFLILYFSFQIINNY